MVFAGSLSINDGVVLLDNPGYPEIVDDYERAIRLLKSLPCDVFLTGHGAVFGLEEKCRRLKAEPGVNPFVDPAGYRRFIERGEAAFRRQLARERQAAGASFRP